MAQDIILSGEFLSPSTIYCRGASLTYGFKPLTRTTPLVNSFKLAETMVTGFENPKIVLSGYIDTNNLKSSTIQHSSLLSIAKNEYDGTEEKSLYLTVVTGKNDAPLYATDATTSTIKVAVESFDIVIDTKDSDLAHFWRYTLNLVETD
jgi:hypothetical protein